MARRFSRRGETLVTRSDVKALAYLKRDDGAAVYLREQLSLQTGGDASMGWANALPRW